MARSPLNFNGPSLEARSTRVNDQRSVNMFPKAATPGSRAPVVMYSCPGLLSKGQIGIGPHRGIPVKFGGNWFTVSGSELYEVTAAGVKTLRGTLSTSSGRIKMQRNATSTQLIIIDGTYMYCWTGTTFSVIACGFAPVDISFLNGFFFAVEANTQNIHLSGSNDGTVWNPIDVDVASASTDNLVNCSTDTGDAWLIGEESLEVWYWSGNADFPITHIPGLVFAYGTPAGQSVVVMESTPIWLATTPKGGPVILTADGRTPRILSNDDLNYQLSLLDTISDAFAFCYLQAGDPFYCITFPSAGKTYVVDVKSGWWHEREAPDGGPWDVAGLIYYNNKHYAVSRTDGTYYQLDFATYQDNGSNRRRMRRAAVVANAGLLMSHHEIEFILEVGVGTLTGDGISPNVQLRWSDDGGKTWPGLQNLDIGIGGDYRKRVVSDRGLGDSYGRIYELSTHHPVDFTIIEAFLDWSPPSTAQAKR